VESSARVSSVESDVWGLSGEIHRVRDVWIERGDAAAHRDGDVAVRAAVSQVFSGDDAAVRHRRRVSVDGEAVVWNGE